MINTQKIKELIETMDLKKDILQNYEYLMEDSQLTEEEGFEEILSIYASEQIPFFKNENNYDKALECNSMLAVQLCNAINDKMDSWNITEKRFAVECFVSVILNRELSSKEKKCIKDACYITEFFETNSYLMDWATDFYLVFNDYWRFEKEIRGNILESIRLSFVLIRGEEKKLLVTEFEKVIEVMEEHCGAEERRELSRIHALLNRYGTEEKDNTLG